ncbi:MAG: hypothetical protein A2087_06565 [Spirochaetes bacterium GWD1_61_31]|nr:MAG: hypothetical protein A2Y37_08905 [Spirochaetes bacterium GWB1_60_80]OHD31890.1 MAG: hypothetical protein A2004_10290 [Spirochaetes bacterium GWC1_61_12]OHD40013.1 MAG: hypothetical protein A2087_06565 [Spirochaetes bacterium GWD1_61_31]OHD42333.1 MAG: hypothetical protein A2Y35_11435 [Spirochaetes bacterium GWE1_60_18]OHD58483.1 MAG: hypothetical protein A2Y32_06940 [Spirochaetes bacterium GWF1_60_12]HAW86943.1 hypothetical protein [Spirochaetaceae bacterium]
MIITLIKVKDDGTILYYTLHDRQPLLMARYALSVAWRSGEGQGREKIYGFETVAEMDRKIRSLFSRRIRAGYKLLYSFMRERPAHSASDAEMAAMLKRRKLS